MPAGFYRDVVKELRKNGFSKLPKRGKGSHEVLESQITQQRALVAKNLKSKNLADSILRDAGIDKRF